PRYGKRNIAPIGDTHPGDYIEEIRACAADYEEIDPAFAKQLRRFPESWDGALDLAGRAFPGFGAMMRGHAYDEDRESFVTVKAGPARNHFQGDSLSFYFCSLGTPLAIDYACHYSPRSWNATSHNRPDMGELRPVTIGEPRAFESSDVADVFVADERTTRIQNLPLQTHNTLMPAREYPTVELDEANAWQMRRYTMLVKHGKDSKIPDYLVVADEIDAPGPVGWNLHMLARDIQRTGRTVTFLGQLDVDVDAHFLESPPLGNLEKRQWGWHGGAGQRRGLTGEAYEKEMVKALIPEDFEPGTWGTDGRNGELAQWMRIPAPAGKTRWLVVLMPHRQGEPAAKVEKLSPTSARVTLGEDSEVIHLGAGDGPQAAVERNGKTTVLLEIGELKPWADHEFRPLPPRRVVERMENP
ncbi:MAG: hypothetical protein ACOC93_06725, partial [Planctomycetota bacterium]